MRAELDDSHESATGAETQVSSSAEPLADRTETVAPQTEAEAFMGAIPQLSSAQWEEIGGRRRLVASVINEGAAPASAIRGIIATIRAAGDITKVSGVHHDVLVTLADDGGPMLDALEQRSDDEVGAVWHAFTSLVRRHHLPAVRFASSYAPLAAAIPIPWPRPLMAALQRYLGVIEGLTTQQCELLAKPIHIGDDVSSALSKAASQRMSLDAEEATALTAVIAVPPKLDGNAGWAAIKTLTFGGRVLGCIDLLSTEEMNILWAPLQDAIPLASVLAAPPAEKKLRPKAVRAPKPPKEPKPPRASKKAAAAPVVDAPVEAPKARARKAVADYGPNSAEVAAFVRDVRNLNPGQWRRVIDRRQAVASVTNEGTDEPATVVRALLAAIRATAQLPADIRAKVYVAAERGAEVPKPDDGEEAWARFAATQPNANLEVVEPMVNAGAALVDFLGSRTDAEVVATWHAVAALVRHHHLSPIKFAVSYAPFSAALPVARKTPLGAPVERYLTAIGRLSPIQCALLAKPSERTHDDAAQALSLAVTQGEGRAAEEEAAMAAVVTVPSRITGNSGWSAVKTVAHGGRVLGCRFKLKPEHIEALWKPIDEAIPLHTLEGG